MSESREFSGLILNRVKKEKTAQKADKKKRRYTPLLVKMERLLTYALLLLILVF